MLWHNLYHADRAALGGFQSATPEFTYVSLIRNRKELVPCSAVNDVTASQK